MHRNTYLLVSILAVIAALVVGVNVGKKITTAPQITQTEQIQQTEGIIYDDQNLFVM